MRIGAVNNNLKLNNSVNKKPAVFFKGTGVKTDSFQKQSNIESLIDKHDELFYEVKLKMEEYQKGPNEIPKKAYGAELYFDTAGRNSSETFLGFRRMMQAEEMTSIKKAYEAVKEGGILKSKDENLLKNANEMYSFYSKAILPQEEARENVLVFEKNLEEFMGQKNKTDLKVVDLDELGITKAQIEKIQKYQKQLQPFVDKIEEFYKSLDEEGVKKVKEACDSLRRYLRNNDEIKKNISNDELLKKIDTEANSLIKGEFCTKLSLRQFLNEQNINKKIFKGNKALAFGAAAIIAVVTAAGAYFHNKKTKNFN